MSDQSSESSDEPNPEMSDESSCESSDESKVNSNNFNKLNVYFNKEIEKCLPTPSKSSNVLTKESNDDSDDSKTRYSIKKRRSCPLRMATKRFKRC